MARIVRFIDGFDERDFFTQMCWKYDQFLGFGSGSMVPGRQPPTAIGGGYALRLANTGFHSANYGKYVGASTSWRFGFSFLAERSGVFADSIFFRLDAGPFNDTDPELVGQNTNCQMSLAIDNDGHLRIYSGGDGWGGATFNSIHRGTQIFLSPWAFADGQWYTLEGEVEFGVGGSVKIWIDDMLAGSVGPVNLGQGAFMADRFVLRLQGFEAYQFDDLYIANQRLGPCRVSPVFMAADQAVQWAPLMGSNVSQIHERPPGGGTIPDGDTTYVAAAGAGLRDFFLTDPVQCYGLNLAIASNVCGRLVAGGPGVNHLVKFRSGVFVLGSSIFPGSILQRPYGIVQQISQLSPGTGIEWVDREVQAQAWGYESTGVGSARITATNLEKLVSLRAVPYTCGVGSYVY